MSKIPDLLRQLADEIEEKENYEDLNLITVNTKLNDLEVISCKNKDKMKEVADAFATFANILGRE